MYYQYVMFSPQGAPPVVGKYRFQGSEFYTMCRDPSSNFELWELESC